jgi:tetratricopeptide (TPR) repeat protein
MAKHQCAPMAHHTEILNPGAQASAASAAAPQQATKTESLWDNLGSLRWQVQTRSDLAQHYFDQGLRLAYAFNHTEAGRSFRAAEAADPGCAMCYWGEALVLGPNINDPMHPEAVEPAFAASAKAQVLGAAASPKEQALIRALGKRYSPDPAADRKVLDAAYADAMAATAASFPDDDNVQALFAESLMDLSPWNYWEADAKTPKGRTAEVIIALETVLKRSPNHPGAIHLYIHAVEASTTPERAEPYADRLAALMPGAGHIVHMPGHIYYRVGRYKDALAANIAAVKIDEAYFAQAEAGGVYRYGYYPHNVHFLLAAALMGGDGATAIAAAEKLPGLIPDTVAHALGFAQHAEAAPYYAHAQFSDPTAILALPEPSRDLPFLQAVRHYARAVAFAAQRDTKSARAEEKLLADLGTNTDFAALKVPNAADVISVARAVVLGRIALVEGHSEEAIAAFRDAVAAQDRLPYWEPPRWYYPVRQSLGAAQLSAGHVDDAIQSFRDSLIRAPNNAYALYGLAQALKAKGDTAGADAMQARFQAAWSGRGTPDLKAM